jgi:hypothetical protein
MPNDSSQVAKPNCKRPDNPTGINCPPPSTIVNSSNVQAAMRQLQQMSLDSGKVEFGAFLFLNPDGTIRVGQICKGTAKKIPCIGNDYLPSDAIGSIHTHDTEDHSSPDDYSMGYWYGIHVVVGTPKSMYVIDFTGHDYTPTGNPKGRFPYRP